MTCTGKDLHNSLTSKHHPLKTHVNCVVNQRILSPNSKQRTRQLASKRREVLIVRGYSTHFSLIRRMIRQVSISEVVEHFTTDHQVALEILSGWEDADVVATVVEKQ